jgi:HTH-type transcriptional regulator/antitoxin HipB
MKKAIAPYGKIDSIEQLGQMIRAKRREIGVEQARVAGLAGVGLRFLSELERGKPTAALGKAIQVIQKLGLEIWIIPRGSKPLR